jgi:high-affinity iron transporter
LAVQCESFSSDAGRTPLKPTTRGPCRSHLPDRALRLGLLFCALLLPLPAAADLRPLLQLIDYTGVDYAEAVWNGQVINALEYAEMQEFAGRIEEELQAVPPSAVGDALRDLAGQLKQAVGDRAEPDHVRALTAELRQILIENFNVELTPRAAPDLVRAQALFGQHCASCHGAGGRGDGPAAAGLDPAPTDFHDIVRARQRSLFGLFNTITLGVDGTGMAGFGRLSDSDRWALAFLVGGFYPDAELRSVAAGMDGSALTLEQAVTRSPGEIAALVPEGELLSIAARAAPQSLFAGDESALAIAQRNLALSLERYRAGDRAGAERAALSAYLDGFELTEAALANVDAKLMRQTEEAMIAYRQAIARGAPPADIERRYGEVAGLLAGAAEVLGGETLSAEVAFLSSLVILLREGLEAILVVGAMVAFLGRTGRRDALRHVHAGWMLALLAGAATWALSTYLIDISGATRELTEGATALLAAAILFYVGFWMHRNANAARWSRYLKDSMQSALDRGTLWALAVVAFLAVYRECFETVLFYQALWLQVSGAAYGAVIGGAVAAALALAVIVWLILRFGVRLPLRQLFLATAVIMVALAIVLAGDGVMSLQEAGKIGMRTLPLPRIEWLGIYPTAQGLAVQGGMLLLAVVLALRQRRSD